MLNWVADWPICYGSKMALGNNKPIEGDVPYAIGGTMNALPSKSGFQT